MVFRAGRWSPRAFVGNARHRATERAADFARVARARAQRLPDDLVIWRHDAQNEVRRNPGRAMLIALALGFTIGFLVRRRQILSREEVFLG